MTVFAFVILIMDKASDRDGIWHSAHIRDEGERYRDTDRESGSDRGGGRERELILLVQIHILDTYGASIC